MTKYFGLLMIFPLIMIMVFQSPLNNLENKRDQVARVVTERATEFAAVEGYYTDEIKQMVIDTLKSVGYTEDEINIKATETWQPRSEPVQIVVKVPNHYTNILVRAMFNQTDDTLNHVSYASRMSEARNN